VAGGTDSAVVPCPPLWVLYHFVSRDTISGGVMGADQKISRKEALQVETINNAYLTFEERTKGSIEPGKLADLVGLPEDILSCPEKRIEQMHVTMTMVGGRVVYRRPQGFTVRVTDFGRPSIDSTVYGWSRPCSGGFNVTRHSCSAFIAFVFSIGFIAPLRAQAQPP